MYPGTTRKMSETEEVALVGLLSAVNVASRLFLQMLPNIKPVTSIIIIATMVFGVRFALELTVTTTLVSDMFLGMGIWTVFQLLAWTVIVFLTRFVTGFRRKNNLFAMAVFAAAMGYVFGFVVSLEKLLTVGWYPFWAYYFSGLLFDSLHAAGNFAFYLICAPVMEKIFRKEYAERT
jgi:energy-coupling factor transport system substrate-specific component